MSEYERWKMFEVLVRENVLAGMALLDATRVARVVVLGGMECKVSVCGGG